MGDNSRAARLRHLMIVLLSADVDHREAFLRLCANLLTPPTDDEKDIIAGVWVCLYAWCEVNEFSGLLRWWPSRARVWHGLSSAVPGSIGGCTDTSLKFLHTFSPG